MTRIHRRRFLAGVGGVAVALPFLESVVFPDSTARAGGSRPVYSFFFKQNNGVAQGEGGEPERFWPSELGALDAATLAGRDSDRAVSELAEYADDLLLVRGTRFGWYAEGCGHAEGSVQCLTAGHPYEVTGGGPARMSNHESIDWRIGREFNPPGVSPLYLMSGWDDGSYFAGPSFRGPGEPRASQNNPLSVYRDLMVPGGGDSEVEAQILAKRRSIIDLVRGELRDLRTNPRLGSADRRRLDDHFESIRDIETRMTCDLAGVNVTRMEELDQAVADDGNRVEVAELMIDLALLIFACDSNRSILLQMAYGASDNTRYYTPDGTLLLPFHQLSHRVMRDECLTGADTGADCVIAGADVFHHEIDRIMARIFRRFVHGAKRDYIGPSGGPLLDDCIAVWTNEVSGGPSHGIDNVPWVIVGSGGGFLRQGQYIDAGGVTHNKLLNTILSAHSVAAGGGYVEDFGDAELERGVINAMIAS